MGESDMRPFHCRVPVATGDDRKNNEEQCRMIRDERRQGGVEMRRGWLIVVVTVLLALPQVELTAPNPQRGGTGVYSVDGSPDRIDPNLSGLRPSQIVFFQIFDQLVVRDPQATT